MSRLHRDPIARRHLPCKQRPSAAPPILHAAVVLGSAGGPGAWQRMPGTCVARPLRAGGKQTKTAAQGAATSSCGSAGQRLSDSYVSELGPLSVHSPWHVDFRSFLAHRKKERFTWLFSQRQQWGDYQQMSAAENVRSFWQAKTRTESPIGSPRNKDGPTMEGLRSTLQRTKSWDKARAMSRTLPTRALDLPSKIVSNSVFKEQDRTPSPIHSPTFGRRSPFAKTSPPSGPGSTSPVLPRPTSPYKSSLASPELGPKPTLSRNKSVTFNESLEVRHMSECSFEETSSPYSTSFGTADHSDEDHNSDFSIENDEDDEPSEWSNATPSKRSGPNLEDPFTSVSRALPNVPGARPLPVVPTQRANSPEKRILATEQEDTRKKYQGLGLHLARQDSKEDLPSSMTETDLKYNADEANIRRASQRALIVSEGSDDETQIVANVETAVIHDLTEKPVLVDVKNASLPLRSIPVLRNYTPSRSPEPPISREYVKEKLAQRMAGRESARLASQAEAFVPNNALAPPLPHFDSFIKLDSNAASDALQAPESPLSDNVFPSVVMPQRKVSDILRPQTPVDQVTKSVPEPQSGRAVHHEREKRISLDLTSTDLPKSASQTFTAICYDGEDYESDLEDFSREESGTLGESDSYVKDVEETSVASAETVQKTESPGSKAESPQSPLQSLREIPDAPHVTQTRIPMSTAFDLRHMSLSLDFDSVGNDSLGLEEYMTPERRPETPITSRTVVPASPVKSHQTDSQLDTWAETVANQDDTPASSPEQATITSRGMKLRTRPSMTPADTNLLAAMRRQVSVELERDDQGNYPSEAVLGKVRSESVSEVSTTANEHQSVEAHAARVECSQLSEGSIDRIQPMAMPVLQPFTQDLSFSDINSAFDRVMQKQKKGYVVRQQSRIVHATANHVEPAAVQEENGKGHTRQSSSVYTTLSSVSGTSMRPSENVSAHRRQGSKIPVGVQMSPRPGTVLSSPKMLASIDKVDGGRLFIRVMHVKHLTLPIPKGEESFFSCTLDNGKHCVTTPWHTLANNTKIDQEFELIADHDLEFILTLQAQYVPPKAPSRPKSTLGRLLTSPKKHRPTGSITSLSLAGYVGDDGSFARAHLALKHFRHKAFGRPYSMVVPVLNEWAVETTGMVSKHVPQTRQRKPYKIGEIELQVLYVPPVGVDHRHALPTSLSQAVRDIRDAEWHSTLLCEGYLSQQGGDCPFWRRRHFKLVGSKLTAYHANTGQVRATINLSKATQVNDDKESLLVPEVTIGRGENQTRRKSGFAEREEGHLYVAEGFRIRFANGEMIDFYADSHREKAKWISILNTVVQKVPVAKAWCQLVLEKESATEAVRR